ncbi:MAG: MotA/TolQ/ExbB proton channel family protein [Pseudomonadota bacterium]
MRQSTLKACALVLLFAGLATPFATAVANTSQLRAEVEQSRQRLAQQEQRIAAASAQLNQRIQRAQQSVIELRREAATLQRNSDDQTLALEVIEARLQRWSEQENYQRNLLFEFARRTNDAVITDGSFDSAVSTLRTAAPDLARRLAPQFDTGLAVIDSGEQVSGRTLRIGPTAWFVHETGGGLLTKSEPNTLPRIVWPMSENRIAEIHSLGETGAATLTFDPTLGRYLEMQASRPSLLGHISAGGVWVIPILGFALLSLAIAAAKTMQFARLPKLDQKMRANVTNALRSQESRDFGQFPEPLSTLLRTLRAPATPQAREDQLFEFLINERNRLQHFIGAVAITATVSPLLGLLGTVSGMINTFRAMTVFGSGDPSVVSGGISEALVTTELGLVVAVPSLIAHALLRRKADSYAEQLESVAASLSEPQS